MYNDFNDYLIRSMNYIDESVYIETISFYYFDEPSTSDYTRALVYYKALNT